MRVAIAGATGFLGQPLVAALCAQGHEVRVLSRDAGRATAQGLPQGAHALTFDGSKPAGPEVLEGMDAVVNLAGENVAARRWTDEVKRRIRDSRVEGTRNLAEAAARAGTVKVMMVASGVGYYGDRGAEPLTEASAPGTDFLAQVCVDREAAALPAAEAGARLVPLRIGIVLHPSGGALAKMLLPFKLGLGGRFGGGAQYFPWIHRDDAVGMMAWALGNAEVRGPLNVVAPEPVTNAAFAKALAQALKRPAVLPVPAFALRAAVGELAEGLLGGQRAMPERALRHGYTFRYPELKAALASLV